MWDKSKLKKALEIGEVNIPEVATLPDSQSKVQFVIVADDAFPLMPTRGGSARNAKANVVPTFVTKHPCFRRNAFRQGAMHHRHQCARCNQSFPSWHSLANQMRNHKRSDHRAHRDDQHNANRAAPQAQTTRIENPNTVGDLLGDQEYQDNHSVHANSQSQARRNHPFAGRCLSSLTHYSGEQYTDGSQ